MVFKKRSESPTCLMFVGGQALPPVMEGPCLSNQESRKDQGIKEWMKEQIGRTTNHLLRGGSGAQSNRRNRAKQLLATLGTSLGPFPVGKLPPTVCPKDSPIETSSAQYIVQQYIAATGGSKLHNSIHNSYATGKFKMHLTEFESAGSNQTNISNSSSGSSSSNSSSSIRPKEHSESGCFVLWQMSPDKWYVELAVCGIKARAGCDSKLVWKQNPFSGSQALRGPIRPLRRALNGLDPRILASMFINARCIGEKRVGDDDCFVLKLAADPFTLNAVGYSAVQPEQPQVEEEVIRHVAFGYFSQRSGLLVRMEDSRLTRATEPRGEVSYWEVTVETVLGDYRAVDDGAPVVAHAGTTVVSVFRFGEESMCHTKTRVEECWRIEDAAYNVVGLSTECFIPPAECKVAAALSDVGEIFIS